MNQAKYYTLKLYLHVCLKLTIARLNCYFHFVCTHLGKDDPHPHAAAVELHPQGDGMSATSEIVLFHTTS